ncbi:CAP domain-containing protein [Clostridium estertheticum]|nr:CAP domain-containing protein [Clostridium estertheticum]
MKKSLRALILTLGILATTGIGSTAYAQDCSTVKQVNSVESIQAICAKYGTAVPKGVAVKAQVAAPCKAAPTKTAPVKAATTKATPAKAVPTKTTATKAAATPAASTSTANNKLEKEVVTLVNKERAKQGLAPLTDNVKLSNVARTKSEDMVAKDYFDHTSPTYGSPFDMMKQFGITYTAAGENIAMGQQTASSVMTSWMNSPGHKANILGKNFTDIGVGVAKDKSGAIYWTQEFIGK